MPPASDSWRALRILLVDDHQDTCVALKRLLERRPYTVATANDASSALEIAARDHFDLLISYIDLPDGTGIELIGRLRASSQIRGIAISGFGMRDDVDKSLRAGFAEHLVKPVRLERFVATIEQVMGGG